MTNDTRTVEVVGYFGAKRITQSDFLAQWDSHMRELSSICNTDDDWNYYLTTREEYAKMALRTFNKMYDNQNPMLMDSNY